MNNKNLIQSVPENLRELVNLIIVKDIPNSEFEISKYVWPDYYINIETEIKIGTAELLITKKETEDWRKNPSRHLVWESFYPISRIETHSFQVRQKGIGYLAHFATTLKLLENNLVTGSYKITHPTASPNRQDQIKRICQNTFPQTVEQEIQAFTKYGINNINKLTNNFLDIQKMLLSKIESSSNYLI